MNSCRKTNDVSPPGFDMAVQAWAARAARMRLSITHRSEERPRPARDGRWRRRDKFGVQIELSARQSGAAAISTMRPTTRARVLSKTSPPGAAKQRTKRLYEVSVRRLSVARRTISQCG